MNSSILISGQSAKNESSYKTVDYYARFNCGTIIDDKGPLRPGKYDSDITIFNKKDFPLTIIWKAIEINQQSKNNFNMIPIPPENIVNINCSKIHSSYLTKNSSSLLNNFVEGIVLIRINVNNGQLINNFFNNQDQSVILDNSEIGNLINVDVLHTVNTLNDLNKEAFYLKTKFSLESPNLKSNNTGSNDLSAVFQIEPNHIIDPIKLIRKALTSNEFNNSESNDLNIKITNSTIFSDTFTDNHALTVQKIEPIIS